MNKVSRHGKDDEEEENSRVHAKTGTSAPENDDTGLRKNSKGRNEKPTFMSQRTLRWNDCRLRSCRRKLILPLRLRCSAAALIIVWARGIDPGFKIQLIYIVTHIHTRDVMRQGRIHNDDDNGKDQSRRNHGRGVPAVAEQWDS